MGVHARVFSHESFRIAFTRAALNYLGIWTCDIKNTYLQSPTTKKYHIVCGQ